MTDVMSGMTPRMTLCIAVLEHVTTMVIFNDYFKFYEQLGKSFIVHSIIFRTEVP